MSYRFTNTDKWEKDCWFINLKAGEKLLFIYLYETCDIAGFKELNYRKMAFDLGIDEGKIEGALKGLTRGLIWDKNQTLMFIRNFIKQQKNLPLNPENKAHVGIINRLADNLVKFGFSDIKEFFNSKENKGAMEGLPSPTGIGKGKKGVKRGKGEKVFIAPTIEDVKIYFKENGYSHESAERFFNGYNVAEWIDSKGNQIKVWKQKAQQVWFKPENKTTIQTEISPYKPFEGYETRPPDKGI
jgi:hypothetical protein